MAKLFVASEYVDSESKDTTPVRNPATGESISIPAKTVVKFRIAKAAKDAIL